VPTPWLRRQELEKRCFGRSQLAKMELERTNLWQNGKASQIVRGTCDAFLVESGTGMNRAAILDNGCACHSKG
jgi:hypothetical protein